MKNEDVCKAFLRHEDATGSNLYSIEGKLFSYHTCIAEWDGLDLLINETKYSVSTSKHQTYLYRNIHNIRGSIISYIHIPMGTYTLKNQEY